MRLRRPHEFPVVIVDGLTRLQQLLLRVKGHLGPQLDLSPEAFAAFCRIVEPQRGRLRKRCSGWLAARNSRRRHHMRGYRWVRYHDWLMYELAWPEHADRVKIVWHG